MDVAIIGAGPAGITAAIVCSRKKLDIAVFEGGIGGGMMQLSHRIENYPGFPGGISGPELAERFVKQLGEYDIEITKKTVKRIRKKGGKFEIISDKSYEAGAVIIATGASWKKLGIKNEERLLGKGISYCASCDGPLFRGKTVAVVGGGNTAVSSALMLEKIAKKVYLIHRRDALRADGILGEKAEKSGVEIVWDSVVAEASGKSVLEEITVKNKKTEKTSKLKVDGLFIEVGVVPKTELIRDIGTELGRGYIKVSKMQETSTPGIFACGDVTGRELQVGVAVGEGMVAATSAYKFLKEG